ncbi:hypothetical protein O3597_17915 [Verrucosispora sp. WMMA2044]|uniref:hypothetical protein n=1 Tax=Verrucosispora sp. WMMA2044 TaxID=3016419 RepID=UPI00248C07C7|nr:hypothetical protein [Verrucosispora sp. WMMA2044]WBB47035.1 hypothetical protein O3597_17915 [Verrucosispora sp. WMMA2044]
MNHPRNAVLAALLTTALAIALHPQSASSAGRADRWTADLSVVDADDVNVRHTRTGLRLADARPPGGSARRSAVAEGMLVSVPRTLSRPATRIRAQATIAARSGATATVQVRGWRAAGWTEWRDAAPAAVFDRPVRRVQARVVLTGSPAGASSEVRAVRLTADTVAATTAATPGLTYRVYATRVGLVGELTANGHTVRTRDHFVALPSRRGLSPRNTGDYTVRVCTVTGSRCEYAPVWDVGPWNTRDDYWNLSAVRENWKALPQGRPQAQAAYQDGYNGGRDQFGRVVLNPAGIDLADGTFWDGLQLSTNAWVDVAYLWTGTGPRGVVGDGPLTVRSGPSTGYQSRGLAAQYANVPIQCYVTGQTIVGPYRTTNRWNRLASGQFVSHAYISTVWGGSVPVC